MPIRLAFLLCLITLGAISFTIAKKLLHSPPTSNQHSDNPFQPLPPGDGGENHLIQIPRAPKTRFKRWAGHLPASNKDETKIWLYYWLTESEKNPSSDPLILWLSGGPGCSSLYGGLLENIGPYRVNTKKDPPLLENEFSWTKIANVLFVDQPYGTGFSFSEDQSLHIASLHDSSVQLHRFLRNFVEVFTEFKDRDFYIFGESFAGMYIPSITTLLLEEPLALNLKGIGIGNGWYGGIPQYTSFVDWGNVLGLLSLEQKRGLQTKLNKCLNLKKQFLETGKAGSQCDDYIQSIIASTGNSSAGYINVYDVRIYDPTHGLDYPPQLFNLKSYLRDKHTIKAINGNPSIYWDDCSPNPFDDLHKESLNSSLPLLSKILSSMNGPRVLIFNGQFDFVCNNLGIEGSLEGMSWPRASEYHSARRFSWIVQDVIAGYVRSGGRLTTAVVLDSGHMPNFDHPERGFDMVSRFIEERDFDDLDQRLNSLPSYLIETPSACVEKPEDWTEWVTVAAGWCGGIIVGVGGMCLVMVSRFKDGY